ncbi:hypothetical protein QBC47DRAFT_306133 [Echria macrotheca]|uniref:Nuclear GTPase SLIP-GC n=1 Tax=Echria macrotheca TaxID=438768 RepID=A0AAJ0B6K9_9PEZI|nr:hypothetical protein QBC47DRAFT_306133 [Echria macrotheca]
MEELPVKAEPESLQDNPAVADVPPKPAIPAQSVSGLPGVKEEQGVDRARDQQIQARQPTDYLKDLLSATSPDILEKGVAAGLRVLDSLRGPLEAIQSVDGTQANHWLTSIQNLKGRAKTTRTIVGVVGNTGAGKSSVISAVLDEERLLPTNCMRACTASPTEISWNFSEDPSELYRAEVEFITADDWTKEVKGLLTDLLDGNGEVSRECTNTDSEAGVAYAKIKAVYPRKTKEMIASSDPDNLASEPAVARVLGTTRTLKARTADSLYRQLQQYVDSKEKNTDKTVEYWPLIKVVRIFTKAAALKTGACLVDLPGVQDSNAARAAVAENYMKACTGLWIVAPITRAVDDKTAKSLLGDSFRRQLKYDGTYSAVTFICSKTDDISITEAAESLDMEDEVGVNWNKIQENKRTIAGIKTDIRGLREERDKIDDRIEENDTTRDKWEKLSEKINDGETVYEPTEDSPSKKRKRQTKPAGNRKNRRSADSDEDFTDSESERSDSDKENGRPATPEGKVLTAEDVEQKMAELKAERKRLRESRREMEEKVAAARVQIRKLQDETDSLTHLVKSKCIKGRNEYSRKAIKKDFAMGIKELDQEAAAMEDESTFDPEVDLRDYDAVAESLPVFCVSSRAFQGLSGRLQKDDVNSSGFQSVDDTEIPQLQAHARKLTEGGRAANSRRFLNDLLQLINSLNMWASNDGTQIGLTAEEKRAEEAAIRSQLQVLEKNIDAAVRSCIDAITTEFKLHVHNVFNSSIHAAVAEAVGTATSWGLPRAQGGLFWATYKATCRREGVFAGAAGPKDFNAELFEPISKNLASGWERAFHHRLPAHLDKFAAELKRLIQSFHDSVIKRGEHLENFQGVARLQDQLRALINNVAGMPGLIRATVQEVQRDASRNMTPQIQESMRPAYETCNNERGPGSYARMKSAMIAHVSAERHTMFANATNGLSAELKELLLKVRRQIDDHVADLHSRVAHDYIAVLIGTDYHAGQGRVSRAERLLRDEMSILLELVGDYFKDIVPELGPVVEETEQKDVPMTGVDEPQQDGGDTEPGQGDAPPVGVVKPEPLD